MTEAQNETSKSPVGGAAAFKQRKLAQMAERAEAERLAAAKTVEREKKKKEKQAQVRLEAARKRQAAITKKQDKADDAAQESLVRPSPAQKFQQRKRAELAEANAEGAPAAVVEDPAYAELRLHFSEDIRKLKAIQSVEKKIEAKKPMFEYYEDHIAGRLEADQAIDDPIFAMLLLWAIDIGRYPLAMNMAAYMVKHGLGFPENFSRSVETAVVENISDRAIKTESDVTHVDLVHLRRLIEEKDWDLLDQVKAKFMKALGRSYRDLAENYDEDAEGNPTSGRIGLVRDALVAFKRAVDLGSKRIGVKNDIRDMEKLLAEIEPAQKE